MAEKITNPEELKEGMVVIRAVVNGTGQFWTEELTLLEDSREEDTSTGLAWKVKTRSESNGHKYEWDMFCGDMIGHGERHLFRYDAELLAALNAVDNPFDFLLVRDGKTFSPEEKADMRGMWEYQEYMDRMLEEMICGRMQDDYYGDDYDGR